MAASTATPVLQMEGISKRFGAVSALTDVYFEVFNDEVVALVGDNGAGKSTLIKVIAGVGANDEGVIRFEGKEVTITKPLDATALGIATVYQDLALCDNLDVVANLFLGREDTRTALLDEVTMKSAPPSCCAAWPPRSQACAFLLPRFPAGSGKRLRSRDRWSANPKW